MSKSPFFRLGKPNPQTSIGYKVDEHAIVVLQSPCMIGVVGGTLITSVEINPPSDLDVWVQRYHTSEWFSRS